MIEMQNCDVKKCVFIYFDNDVNDALKLTHNATGDLCPHGGVNRSLSTMMRKKTSEINLLSQIGYKDRREGEHKDNDSVYRGARQQLIRGSYFTDIFFILLILRWHTAWTERPFSGEWLRYATSTTVLKHFGS